MNNKYVKKLVPKAELESRMERFRSKMDNTDSEWSIAVIFSKMNMFYLTGTMQDGMLVIPRDEDAILWVRRSYERAVDESDFPLIRQMDSYKTARASYNKLPDTVHIETEFLPVAMYQRFSRYFDFKNIKPLDMQLSMVRAVKSEYELELMKKSGKIHEKVLEQMVPGLLKEGISETELSVNIYSLLVHEGHHGLSRVRMLDTEMVLGNTCFGESSLYPTYFNGPGGIYGLNAAVPLLGNRERKLKAGDLVFVDVGCGYDGYHTDKTMTYVFSKSLPEEAEEAHKKCLEIQETLASMLLPGAIPSDIYNSIIGSLNDEFLENFMGYGKRKAKFLGHGIGLAIDEMPVIADGFEDPLQENMTIALEPKKGIPGVGMVGVENTFIVEKKGGKSITGHNNGLIAVGL